MRAVLLALLIFVSYQSWSQNSKLTVFNPGPRVGDDIEISITLEKENLEAIKSKSSKSIEEFNQVQSNYYGSGTIKLSDLTNEPGLKQIGPFEFNLNGVSVKTDSILLTIYPALPGNKKDGMWVRIIDFNGDSFLIIEQRISNDWKREKGKNSTTFSHGGDDVKFAKLDEAKFEAKGLDIISSSSSSSSQIVDKDDVMGSGTVSFNIDTYQFKKTVNFNNAFKLDKKMFIDFTHNIEDVEAWIK
ncbi:hypothetical protein [Pontibacter populi]|uniref:Uncharacterized protein n=1 Tax=Pontibacter populi TaxID=890055 RepID=A0ABV1RNK9_9BACT